MLKQILNQTPVLFLASILVLHAFDIPLGILKAKRKNNISSRQLGIGIQNKLIQFSLLLLLIGASYVFSFNDGTKWISVISFTTFNGASGLFVAKEILSIFENLVDLGVIDKKDKVFKTITDIAETVTKNDE